MPKITNHSKQLLIVPLNSGNTLHLAPGESSQEFPDYELADNSKVDKMTNLGLARVSRTPAAAGKAAQPASAGAVAGRHAQALDSLTEAAEPPGKKGSEDADDTE